ncbi:MAG: phosphomannomutase/phosphoglucomutase [Bdellovibrionota bacterium]|nr:phosphomannomutase/phosphoglucomutase [Bdellovibrionota bacterium]
MFSPVIFREYDIRGVYETDFDLDFAKLLGKAFVSFHNKKTGKTNPKIVIGNDARLSSPAIVNALAEGMSDAGAQVFKIGLVTTAMTYFTTFFYDFVDGAIMVTGSHNPPDYNGFKISLGKTTISGSEIQELRTIIDTEDFVSDQGSIEDKDIFPDYINRYKEEFGQLENIPVVIDCGNGAAGCVLRDMYASVGLKPTILFEEPDGRFPNHHPDPTVEENMEALKAKVLEVGAKVGIGFDGDADRIGLVDDKGKFLLGDEILCLMSRNILAEHPGQKVVADVKCSDRLFDDIKKHGGEPVMWNTGHSLIKNKIKELKIPFGGEYSGHVFYNDRNYGFDDALYAGLRVIEVIVKTGKGVSELLNDWPEAYNTPEIRIDTTEEKKVSIVEAVKEHFKTADGDYKVNDIDGIRISFKDGWALARASNTQPVLSLRFEANSEENLQKIRTQIEDIIKPLL